MQTFTHDSGAEESDNGMLQIYIQPFIDLCTCGVVGGEALARWEQGEKMWMPDEFIPALEANGNIISFDFLVLDKVCAFLRRWIDEGRCPLKISVNQSRKHLMNKNDLEQFTDIVDYYRIPHHLLAVELTETALVEGRYSAQNFAEELKRKGFALYLDDFGSGYASLDLLGRLVPEVVKVDRELLGNAMKGNLGKIILQKILELARESGMRVICEGIETQEQHIFLQEMGYRWGQGFLFWKPMPAEEFANRFLKKSIAEQHFKIDKGALQNRERS